MIPWLQDFCFKLKLTKLSDESLHVFVWNMIAMVADQRRIKMMLVQLSLTVLCLADQLLLSDDIPSNACYSETE
jgi:hypothetical protein